MRNLLVSAAFAAALGVSAGAASAAECGAVTIANMNWQSAEVLANIDKIILNAGYGCKADLVVGDTVPTLTSMTEKGQPDVAPEGLGAGVAGHLLERLVDVDDRLVGPRRVGDEEPLRDRPERAVAEPQGLFGALPAGHVVERDDGADHPAVAADGARAVLDREAGAVGLTAEPCGWHRVGRGAHRSLRRIPANSPMPPTIVISSGASSGGPVSMLNSGLCRNTPGFWAIPRTCR